MLSLDSLISLSNCETNSKPWNQLLRELHARSERVIVYNFQKVTRIIRNHSNTKECARGKQKTNKKLNERVRRIQSADETTSNPQLEKIVFQ